MRRDDRGAVLVIVAVFAVVAVLMLAFVVDIGGLRQEKKEVTLSTDAAALAVAAELDLRTFGVGEYGCETVPIQRENSGDPIVYADTVFADYLDRNGATVEDGCRVVVTGRRRGYVVVGGLEDVPYALSGAVGQASGRVSGVSASVARVDSGGGLRPIGLCEAERSINVDPDTGAPYSMAADVVSAPVDGDGYLDEPVDMVIGLQHLNSDSDDCSVGAPGQRGQLDFDTSQNGNGGTNRCTDPDPDPEDADAGYFTSEYRFGWQGEVEEWTPTDSGADFNGLSDCFVRDIDEEQLIWLPIFSQYDPPPDPTMRLVAFAQAQLTGYCLTNSNFHPTPASYECLAEDPDAGPDRPWLRLWITRVVDFDETGPPLTDDALKDSPAICAERDESALLTACVPPNPPPLGTPPDPTPPSTCDLGAVPVTPSSQTITLGSGNKVQPPPPSYVVSVSATSTCVASDFVVRAVPPSGAVRTLVVSGPASGVFTATLPVDTPLRPGTPYTIEVAVADQLDTSARLVTNP